MSYLSTTNQDERRTCPNACRWYGRVAHGHCWRIGIGSLSIGFIVEFRYFAATSVMKIAMKGIARKRAVHDRYKGRLTGLGTRGVQNVVIVT